MIGVSSDGDYKKFRKNLEGLLEGDMYDDFDKFGEKGVAALSLMTPQETGLTAGSWGYSVTRDKDSTSIAWSNSNTIDDGTPVVILLQYGHGTRTGGYVQGRDFINPAIQPIFDQIELDVWKKVTGE